MKNLWFSIFDFSFVYKGDEPGFIDEEFEWSNDFQIHFGQIKAELDVYMKAMNPESYFNQSMVNEQNSWKTISLKRWDIEFSKKQKHFPVTAGILRKYPSLISLSFNYLEPNGRIKHHCGDTNAIYRCHFGLEIPSGLPETGFRVRNEWREWHEGNWLIFMDAYEHEAINLSKNRRIILVIDYLRPEFFERISKIISTVMTSLFLQRRAEKWQILKKFPFWFIKLITILLRPFALLEIKRVTYFNVY